ncbi:hypothetical protein OKW33_006331 [Paraburkholderia atlantica]|uniref:Secreted protein n=1 Tax=Paraburkholderia atlantica TaxID=2654982 RepID=A0A7W8QFV0_PARAM|nr:hypothetical protein [Paraburkholderia atlantica]
MKLLRRIGLLLCLAFASGTSIAGPARCSPGNQDSSCVGMITTAWQAPPTCPTDAGWTTVAAAQWIGSQYSAPQCNYQAPLTCPSDYAQTSAAYWTGSAWVPPVCVPRAPVPPQPTLPQLSGVCSSALNEFGVYSTFSTALLDGLPQPVRYGGYQPSQGTTFVKNYTGAFDTIWAYDANGSGNVGECDFQAGTATLIDVVYWFPWQYDGG